MLVAFTLLEQIGKPAWGGRKDRQTERLMENAKVSHLPSAGVYSKSTSIHYSRTCLKPPLKKKTKFGFQDRILLNAGQKYCRMLQREHSAILSTFIKLPFVIKIFVLSIFEWPLKTGLTVIICMLGNISWLSSTEFSKLLFFF